MSTEHFVCAKAREFFLPFSSPLVSTSCKQHSKSNMKQSQSLYWLSWKKHTAGEVFDDEMTSERPPLMSKQPCPGGMHEVWQQWISSMSWMKSTRTKRETGNVDANYALRLVAYICINDCSEFLEDMDLVERSRRIDEYHYILKKMEIQDSKKIWRKIFTRKCLKNNDSVFICVYMFSSDYLLSHRSLLYQIFTVYMNVKWRLKNDASVDIRCATQAIIPVYRCSPRPTGVCDHEKHFPRLLGSFSREIVHITDSTNWDELLVGR